MPEYMLVLASDKYAEAYVLNGSGRNVVVVVVLVKVVRKQANRTCHAKSNSDRHNPNSDNVTVTVALAPV
jgi:hypothetical protein